MCLFVCWFVCLLFIGHTTFVHFAALPPSTPRAAKPSRAAPRAARASMHTAREHAHACRTTSQRKNRTLMPFKNKTVRARMLSYTKLPRFSKKGKKKTNMPLPKFSLQFAFSWSVYFSNRTESYSSQIEFAGPHGIICNFTFSYLILSKTIGRKRLRTQCLVGADLGQLVYTYKRVVCVCLFVGLSVCFLSATRHLSTLRRCLRVSESSQAVAGGPAPRARGQACTAREHARACRTTSQRKNRGADAFQKQNRTRA